MAIGLTKYGRREIAAASGIVACIVACILIGSHALGISWLWPVVACALLLDLHVFVLLFFRDPDRTPPEGAILVSPADGVVTDITPVGADSELGCDGTRVGVFMSVFNVHVNRAPCDGEVTDITHNPGAFLDVRKPEAAYRNESATVKLVRRADGTEHTILVRQIAGLVARRIVTDLSPGQQVAIGERIGMIKFGSRLEVFWPRELSGQVCVSVGQKALAGETVVLGSREVSSQI